MNKSFTNINDAITYVYEEASKMAIIGVNVGDAGPFGAGIIKKKNNIYEVISIAHNTVVRSKDPTAHAEVNAIRDACKKLNTNDLHDCILITTAKSCPMCLSAAIWANIKTIYYSEDYEDTTEAGFRDDAILQYIKGNNNLIKEIQIKNDICNEPFIKWNNNSNKINY